MTYQDQLKGAFEKKKAILGFRQSIKYLRKDDVKFVVVASNIPEGLSKELYNFAEQSKTVVEKFNGTGKQLGVFCGKPFSISVVSVRK